MSGLPYFNFPAFLEAAHDLRNLGHEVFSPAERDNARHGTDISANNPSGDIREAITDHGFNLREALAEDTDYICRHAEAIAMLAGWEHSAGARAEHALANALKLKIIYL